MQVIIQYCITIYLYGLYDDKLKFFYYSVL